MNRKVLLGLLLWVMGVAFPALAQNTLTVCAGTATSNSVPIYGLYVDSYLKCEYVIPADSLQDMNGRVISSLTWTFSNTPSAWSGQNFKVFLSEVEDETINAYTGLEGAKIVYEGGLTASEGQLIVNFTTGYTYNGGNLLVGVYNTVKGNYSSCAFLGFAKDGASVQGYSASSLDAITATQRNFIPQSTFAYMNEGERFYDAPSGFAVSNIGTNGAVLSWTAGSDETAWEVNYKKAAVEDWTSVTVNAPVLELEDLSNATIYDVRVRGDYGNDHFSDWIATQFTTLVCDAEDMTTISYTLTDSYRDGWNGNAVINVVHASSGIIVETLKLPYGSGNSSLSGEIQLCYDEEYNFVWVKGSYDSEVGFTFSDANGEFLTHAAGSTLNAGTLITYKPSRVTCKKPTGLAAADVVYNGATLSWTPGDEDQNAWQVIYGSGTEFSPDMLGLEPVMVNGEPTLTLTDLEENTTYKAYVRAYCGEEAQSVWSDVCTFTTPVRYPMPTGLAVSDVMARTATVTWNGEAETYNLRYRTAGGYETFFSENFENGMGNWKVVDSDGDGYNWQLTSASSFQFNDGTTLQGKDGNMIAYSSSYGGVTGGLYPDNWLISPKLDLQGTLRYWVLGDPNYPETYQVYISTTDTEIQSFTPLADKTTTPSVMEWTEVAIDLSEYAGQQGYIAFRNYDCHDMDFIFLDAVGLFGDEIEEGEWVELNGVTSPVALEGLNPLTKYEVQVQAVYDDDVTTDWTESVEFTTLSLNEKPMDLVVDNIEAYQADASWNGVQDSYNLRYRKPGMKDGFFEDFESYEATSAPLVGWTQIDADGDGNVWYIFKPENTTDNLGNPTVFDNVCITSASYLGGALNPDNWLITPQIKLNGQLSMWLRGQDPSYPAEVFAVYVSTTGNTSTEDFTEIIPRTVVDGVYTEYTYDLTSYNDQMGYIAIRHYDVSDKFRLNLDNFFVKYGEDIDAGEWVVAENVTSPYTMTDLEPETTYEVQVQGIIDEQTTTDWTASTLFTTPEAPEQPDLITELYLVGEFNGWNQLEGGGRKVFEINEDGVFETTADLELIKHENNESYIEFKLITPDENGIDGWRWFGGVDEYENHFFLIQENLLGQEITLVDGANFRITEAGNYTFYVMTASENDEPVVGPSGIKRAGAAGVAEPLSMIVVKNTITGVTELKSDAKGDNLWYNIHGMVLKQMPTEPGLYIHNGKKVIIK